MRKPVARFWIAALLLPAWQAAGAQAPANDAAAATGLADNAAVPIYNPQVVAFVEEQFPSADADADGILTAWEFAAWIGALKAAELEQAGQAAAPGAVKAYADNALAVADTDADKILSREELVVFFGG